jgi:hypothetical protein
MRHCRWRRLQLYLVCLLAIRRLSLIVLESSLLLCFGDSSGRWPFLISSPMSLTQSVVDRPCTSLRHKTALLASWYRYTLHTDTSTTTTTTRPTKTYSLWNSEKMRRTGVMAGDEDGVHSLSSCYESVICSGGSRRQQPQRQQPQQIVDPDAMVALVEMSNSPRTVWICIWNTSSNCLGS